MNHSPTITQPRRTHVVPADIPLLFEDEVPEMGEGNLHFRSIDVAVLGVETHLEEHRPELQVFANLNMYYPLPEGHQGRRPCVAPDLMVVEPYQRLPVETRSYTIGRDGPVPLLTTE